MRSTVETPEDTDPLGENAVKRVASVPGVAWAVPYYKSVATLRTDDGRRRSVMLIGVDDHSLIAAPPQMQIGRAEDLRGADAVIVDIAAYRKIFPDQPVRVGGSFEIGRRRAVVVGVCRARAPFNGMDVIYTRRSLAIRMAQEGDNTVSFVLAKAIDGHDPATVASLVRQRTGLRANSTSDFIRLTVDWYLANSGITEVLGTAIILGLVVGTVIVGQTFYTFGLENIRQFATLKAIGLSNQRVLQMLLVQAIFVALVGYGLGLGGTVLLFDLTAHDTSPLRGMHIEAEMVALSAVIVIGITMIAALISARRVLTVEPGLVFRG